MKLSICIPTYNRKEMLSELLNSIVQQLTDDILSEIEIVISDNCSEDGTEAYIKNFQDCFPDLKIVYSRNDFNIGPDRNFIKVVELANGEYAWIVGSDDKINDNALQYILECLEDGFDLYLSNRDDYSCDFSKLLGTRYFFKKEINKNLTINLSTIDDWDKYFNICISIGGVCSYLSSLVFRREMFLSVVDYEDFIGTAYVHVYMLLKSLYESKNSKIQILSNVLVKCRMGNDSFLKNGFQRYMLDYCGYLQISKIFVEPLLKRDFLNILVKEHPFIPVSIVLKMNKGQINEFMQIANEVGYDSEYLSLVQRQNKHKIATCFLYVDKLIKTIYKRRR